MNVGRINLALAALLFILLALMASNAVDYSQPNYEFLPNMKRSRAAHAYSANSVFPDGRTMQMPVAGTIARGELPLHYAPTKEDAVRAGEELLNPFAADAPASPSVTAAASTGSPLPPGAAETVIRSDPAARLQESVQRGAEIYAVYCSCCHGTTGLGDGPVARRGFPPPPPLPSGKSLQMKDGQLFHILTFGQGSMSSMAAQLSRDQRWDVINFVRSLQRSGTTPAAPERDAATEPVGLTVPESAAPAAAEKRP